MVTGCLKLVKVWTAIGHPVSGAFHRYLFPLLISNVQKDTPTISKDYIRSGKQFGIACNAVMELGLLSHRINMLYDAIDPTQFNALVELMNLVKKEFSHVAALSKIDPLVMEGRAIMFNRMTPNHPDSLDPPRGWAFLAILGNFTEGKIYIRRLGLRMRYIPGDVVAIRGKILEHEVEAWVGGQRISIAHFTHQTLFEAFGKECP